MSGIAAALMEQTLGFQRVGIIITFSSEASISAPLQTSHAALQSTKVASGGRFAGTNLQSVRFGDI